MIVEKKCNFGITKIVSYCDNQPMREGDIVQYIHAYKRFDDFSAGKTLLTDLRASEESLFSGIKAKTRNEIRRAEKEKVITKMYVSEEITDDMIKSFAVAYIQFRTEKELPCPTINEMAAVYKMARQLGSLVFSEAVWNEQTVARHVYYANMEDHIVILHQSFSLYRKECTSKQRVGNSNRFLHWEDIKMLKSKDFFTLDWGGYNMENEEVRNISRFKSEFGGVETDVYSGEIYRTFKGKLVRLPLHFKRALNRK